MGHWYSVIDEKNTINLSSPCLVPVVELKTKKYTNLTFVPQVFTFFPARQDA